MSGVSAAARLVEAEVMVFPLAASRWGCGWAIVLVSRTERDGMLTMVSTQENSDTGRVFERR
ncbi:MAG TPA: hypothetical protein VG187_14355 [Mycobacterium sp.]|jgi:hypothetical protein|nr:hypothetical protein [Mycobacterium sp.]